MARGLVPFALSTDAAGSGSVPAAFDRIAGASSHTGAMPSTGLVPACRTLDCVGVLALNVADHVPRLTLMEGVDAVTPPATPSLAKRTPLAQLRVGVPRSADCRMRMRPHSTHS